MAPTPPGAARASLALAAAAAALLLAGCEPNCRDACRHLLEDCGIERADWGIEDCTVGCERYLAHYEDEWQKPESRQSVRCVRNASCDELAGGLPCYDEAVYVW